MSDFDFGMVGLGTMGKALLLNMADHGFRVAGFDTDPVKAAAISQFTNVEGFSEIRAFVQAIRRPRAIMMLVPAGAPVDSVIASVSPLLEPGDFLIDGGNSYYKDTDRREAALKLASFGFMGMGISGGEAGARSGPSMMPGGSPDDYARIKPIVEAIAAQYDGVPCVALMGSGSAGHYVKMVHNGIEYAMMQIIAEVYDLLHRAGGQTNAQIAARFASFAATDLAGFLIEITATVLSYREPNGDLVDVISDKAKSKGTGKWTSQDAMDLGLPTPTIDAAVSARELSGYRDQRLAVSGLGLGSVNALDAVALPIEQALRAAMLLAYVQGLAQIRTASEEYGYQTDLNEVIRVWRAGCIIRSKLLDRITETIKANGQIENLLLSEKFARHVSENVVGLREVVIAAQAAGIPAPCLSASLAYFDGYRSARLPANLIQAQRDLFGAHTYERLDQAGSFHTKWEVNA